MRFSVNPELLVKAHSVLAERRNLYWVVGGACAGKSTVCRALAAEHGIPVYDVDAHTFGDYGQRRTEERHPAMSAWFTAANPFAWLLDLPPDEFQQFNRALTAEYVDLVADDMQDVTSPSGFLIDGGIASPELLVQVMPVRQIACLEITETLIVRSWQESPDRRAMQEMVFSLAEPDVMWHKFLLFDRLIRRNIVRECGEASIPIHTRDEKTPIQKTVNQVAKSLGLRKARSPRSGNSPTAVRR